MVEAEGALRRVLGGASRRSCCSWYVDAVVADQCSSVMLICPDAGSIFHEPVPPRHTVVTPLNSIQVLSAVCVSCIDGMARDGFGEFHGEL
jgi:hypothetical protein